MTERITLIEGSEQFNQIKDGWKQRIQDITLETLPDFLRDLDQNYNHDYGTIVHAVAAAAQAAARAFDRGRSGGITGFQAGAVMWEFIRGWMHKEGPMRLVSYDDLLYPQKGDTFANVLTPDMAEWLIKQAREKLAESEQRRAQKIDKLMAAFAETWKAEDRAGPNEEETAQLREVRGAHPTVVAHWELLSHGHLPFGFTIEEEPPHLSPQGARSVENLLRMALVEEIDEDDINGLFTNLGVARPSTLARAFAERMAESMKEAGLTMATPDGVDELSAHVMRQIPEELLWDDDKVFEQFGTDKVLTQRYATYPEAVRETHSDTELREGIRNLKSGSAG